MRMGRMREGNQRADLQSVCSSLPSPSLQDPWLTGSLSFAAEFAESKQKIMRHIQAHTGHKPFICPTCNQTFSEAATLSQHQRRHTNESQSDLTPPLQTLPHELC